MEKGTQMQPKMESIGFDLKYVGKFLHKVSLPNQFFTLFISAWVSIYDVDTPEEFPVVLLNTVNTKHPV